MVLCLNEYITKLLSTHRSELKSLSVVIHASKAELGSHIPISSCIVLFNYCVEVSTTLWKVPRSALHPSRISALAKFSLSKFRTYVVSNLLYSSTQNCTKTIHSSKLYTPEPPLHYSLPLQKNIYENPDIYRELSPQHRQRDCSVDPAWSPGPITAELAESRIIPH